MFRVDERARRWALGIGTLLMVVPATPIWAQRQPVRTASNDRGQFVDGLVRDLIDSQINFHATPLEPIPSGNANVEMQRARQQLQQFSELSNRIVSALRLEERYSPSVRPLLAEMLRIKAYADALIRKTQTSTDARQLITDYAELDRTWRLAAHQLQQMSGLGAGVQQTVTALNQVNNDVGQLMKVAPQLERSELIQYFVALRSDLDVLEEDISIDLFGHPEQTEFAQRVRSLRSTAQQLQLAAENRYPYDYIKSTYQGFFSQWRELKVKLRAINNRYIQRHVSRITTQNENLHKLLWLPPIVDGNEILYLAESLKSNVDHVSDQITLRQLMAVPNAELIFGRAADFYSLCEDFRATVARETEFNNVRWDFRELDVAWNDLRTVLLPLNDPETNQRVALIDQSIMGLRTALGLRSQVDRTEALQTAATLYNMTDLLNYDVIQLVGQSSRYPAQFRNQAIAASNAFRSSVRALYDGVSRQASQDQLRSTVQTLGSDWSRLMQVVNQIPADQRTGIARTVHQISPSVAKLQVMFAY